jgi:hypothetical protein
MGNLGNLGNLGQLKHPQKSPKNILFYSEIDAPKLPTKTRLPLNAIDVKIKCFLFNPDSILDEFIPFCWLIYFDRGPILRNCYLNHIKLENKSIKLDNIVETKIKF